jgi:hypothetical protein
VAGRPAEVRDEPVCTLRCCREASTPISRSSSATPSPRTDAVSHQKVRPIGRTFFVVALRNLSSRCSTVRDARVASRHPTRSKTRWTAEGGWCRPPAGPREGAGLRVVVKGALRRCASACGSP